MYRHGEKGQSDIYAYLLLNIISYFVLFPTHVGIIG